MKSFLAPAARSLRIALALTFAAGSALSSVPGPHSAKFWQARIAKIHPGMKREAVEKLLPIFSGWNDLSDRSYPRGHLSRYSVDAEWVVEIPFDFNGFIDDPVKNPYSVLHLYDNRVIGPIRLIHEKSPVNGTQSQPNN